MIIEQQKNPGSTPKSCQKKMLVTSGETFGLLQRSASGTNPDEENSSFRYATIGA